MLVDVGAPFAAQAVQSSSLPVDQNMAIDFHLLDELLERRLVRVRWLQVIFG